MAKRKAARKKATRKRTRKKSAPKKAARKKRATRKKAEPKLQPEILDGLVLMLASGASADAATSYAVEKANLTPKFAADHVTEARRRITLAAHYNRDEELGTAYTRLNLLFQQSNRQRDYKSALAAQKELNRLLSLHQPPPADDDQSDSHQNAEADAIRNHLEPLQLAAAGTPPVELVRLAVLAILGADLE